MRFSYLIAPLKQKKCKPLYVFIQCHLVLYSTLFNPEITQYFFKAQCLLAHCHQNASQILKTSNQITWPEFILNLHFFLCYSLQCTQECDLILTVPNLQLLYKP